MSSQPEDKPGDDSTTPPRRVASLIATLPTAVLMHRTIDQFYDQAHAYLDKPTGKTCPEQTVTTCSRMAYFCIFVALGLANVGDAAEIGSMGFLLANYDFRSEVVQGRDGLVAAALYMGMLVGGLVAGPLCDVSGRRNVLLLGLFLNSGFGVGAALSGTPWELIFCRLIMGLGIGAVVSCLLALTSEHTCPRHRGFYLNFVSAFWTIGSIYVAALAMVLFGRLDRSWRLYVLLNALPSCISFFLVICFVPESARFLAVKGQHERAAAVANRIASMMGFTGEKLQVDEVRAHFPSKERVLQRQASSSSLNRGFKTFRSLYSKGSIAQTCGVQMLWILVSFGSGMCLWVTRIFSELPFMSHIYTMSFVFAICSIPGVILSGYILDKMGRTTLLTVSLIGTTISLVVFGFLTLYTTTAWIIVSSACVFHSCLVISWSVLSVVTAEVFPTNVRSTAMGLCASSGRLASIIVHIAAAPLIETQNPAMLLFLGAGSFGLGVVASFTTGLQNRTGEPLRDVEDQTPRKAGTNQQRNLRVASQD